MDTALKMDLQPVRKRGNIRGEMCLILLGWAPRWYQSGAALPCFWSALSFSKQAAFYRIFHAKEIQRQSAGEVMGKSSLPS